LGRPLDGTFKYRNEVYHSKNTYTFMRTILKAGYLIKNMINFANPPLILVKYELLSVSKALLKVSILTRHRICESLRL
jgi:hypothetical protein